MRVKRRDLLAGVAIGTVFAAGNAYLWQAAQDSAPEVFDDALGEADSDWNEAASSHVVLDRETPIVIEQSPTVESVSIEEKVRNFEHDFNDDIFLADAEKPLLESVIVRLDRAQRVVGHGHFNVLDFDRLLNYARAYPSIGAFTPLELEFIEKVYFTNARDYGFLGGKVTDNLTAVIAKSDIVKVPYSGHFLFKGESQHYYETLKADIGPNVILTSGIRSNVKQLHLFLSKASASAYNLSKASRSLAPPGHSYHGIGDFDVGRVGWGAQNFTGDFAKTDEFKRMQDLGYVQIRYTKGNQLGVRFEPWHIKVV